ncbi:MAG TPA: tripartite tricarboxylate transporter substrate binding protein [Alphaproteobacteria bacterium]
MTNRILASLLLLLASTAAAQADSYPSHPLRLLQGFAPGGNVDNVARVLAAEMQKGLGQPVIVESKVGAGGNVAADVVAKSSPDGYTLLLAAGAHPASAVLYKSLNFRPVDDFAWISIASTYPFVVLIRPDSPIRGLPDLLQAAREKPGAVSYGSAGPGSIQHMTGELLASMAGVKFLHVPYRGEAPAVTALLGHETDFVITTTSLGLAQTESGALRPIAVSGSTRWTAMPDVPTVAEQGVPGFEVTSWSGVATTHGTPQPIVDRLNAEMRRVLAVREVKDRLEGFGGTVAASTPAELRERVAREVARWAKVVEDAGIERQ